MRIDREQIKVLERENDCTALCTVREDKMYTYIKIKKRYMDKVVYFPVTFKNGGSVQVAFIPNAFLAEMKDLRFSEEPKPKKRGWVGRPFAFCAKCAHKADCSADIPCDKRDKALASRTIAKMGDVRFWDNGKPKKHLILCRYVKYLYAHKVPKGTCQKELCKFYQDGACYLSLDK